MGNKQVRKKSIELSGPHIELLKATTHYTDREILEWHACFLRDFPSGRLNKEGLLKIHKRIFKEDDGEAFCKFALETFDVNRDGTIDFEEFLLAVAALSHGGDIDERLGFAFDMYNLNSDGQMDQKELAQMISSIYNATGETSRKGDREPNRRAAHILAKLDINGDRKISRQEFIDGCKADPVLRHLLAANS